MNCSLNFNNGACLGGYSAVSFIYFDANDMTRFASRPIPRETQHLFHVEPNNMYVCIARESLQFLSFPQTKISVLH